MNRFHVKTVQLRLCRPGGTAWKKKRFLLVERGTRIPTRTVVLRRQEYDYLVVMGRLPSRGIHGLVP